MQQTKRAKPIQQIKTSVVYVVHHLRKYTNRRYAEMINLMQGECLELMKTIPDGSVDMI
jgi:predicted methyltransferase